MEYSERVYIRDGSSPHTRGARAVLGNIGPGHRIIPAYAGSTSSPTRRRSRTGDHPRIRGEHAVLAVHVDRGGGSSPHTRGARLGAPHRRTSGRIIPAYAGSTVRSGALWHLSADHPRIRGEHVWAAGPGQTPGGSSPHTRGAQPASGDRGDGPVDHPRIRGEHLPGDQAGLFEAGSSPHTRGAQRAARPAGELHGIIPAYAGSTRPWQSRSTPSKDHPRIRGEHTSVTRRRSCVLGSSPHTRGARRPPAPKSPEKRIIPAYAGSTSISLPPGSPGMDHPRIRGEHQRAPDRASPGPGSSPHTRGARPGFPARAPRAGIIPAYAGSTRA